MKKSLIGPSRLNAKMEGPNSSKQEDARVKYTKPSIQEAGSIFLRTHAVGAGTKDIINGSTLL